MIGVLLLAASLGLLEFEWQELPGVQVGPINELTGEVSTNFLHADMDDDSAADLVLSTGIAFQRNGQFPDSARHIYPPALRDGLIDVWEREIFVCTPEYIRVASWEKGALRINHEAPSPFPPALFTSVLGPQSQGNADSSRVSQFLHDIDGDGEPEIIVPVETGLAVYRWQDRSQPPEALGRWQIFPAPSPAPVAPQTLWPPEAREPKFPVSTMACSYVLSGATARVVQRHEGLSGESVHYDIATYAYPDESPLDTTSTPALPAVMQPCRLGGDERIDYAGGRYFLSETTAMPAPIFEVSLTTDGGASVQTFRSRFLRPRCLFADVNGDGRADLIMEETGLFSGGARETLSRSMTNAEVEHVVRVHYQDANGHFAQEPGITADLTIHLESPPLRDPPLLDAYRRGHLIDLTGDLNGDKQLDLVIHDRSDRIRVYLNQGDNFRLEPGAEPRVEGPVRFYVYDLNADGAADILVEKSPSVFTAYFTTGMP